MILRVIAYTVECLARTACGAVYELSRGDGRPPDRPKRCDRCGARVRATPILG